MNVSELKAVREKIAQGWTQNAVARNQYGERVATSDEQASCWCLEGAGLVALSAWKSRFALPYVLGFHGGSGMVRWNDDIGRTQAEVLDRIDTAIARLALAEGEA